MYNPTGPYLDNPQVGFARLLMVTPENETGFTFSRFLPTNQAVQWARDMNGERERFSNIITFRVITY